MFVGLFVPSLSSCYEKATVVPYFGRIYTRLKAECSVFQCRL